MHDNDLCPCGSGKQLTDCCQPILDNHLEAKTAEQLMRSRYTAFVLRHDQHILGSWHSSTRPKVLNHEDHPVVWLGLEIHNTFTGTSNDTTGSVDFTSSYLENGQICRLRENSQFLQEDGLWYYLKGECNISYKKVARSKPCPCGSGKKFKRCCLNNK